MSTTAPITHGVQVVEFNDKGEPWPIATIYIDAASRVQFSAEPGRPTMIAASKAYGPLLTAAKKASVVIAKQNMLDALAKPEPLTTTDPKA